MAPLTLQRTSGQTTSDAGILLHDHAPTRVDFLQDVIAGLSLPEKQLSCKYFYDEDGSRLFDLICETDEYYPTRTELSIMCEKLPEMSRQIGPGALLVEYGSGTSLKTRLLLSELDDPAGYVPIDICREHLVDAAQRLSTLFPELTILPVCGDYTSRLQLPEPPDRPQRRVVYFPGSTIGNFYPSQAHQFLLQAGQICGANGGMLVGVDLRKDTAVLNAAYNDSAGVTAQFNINLLHRINRELGGGFDVEKFDHYAQYNAFRGRIEMHLVSRESQYVRIGDSVFTFLKEESILTECSYKYDIDGFTTLAEFAGWSVGQVWTDPAGYFALFYLRTR